jgi:hypothetical protein
MVAWPAVHSSNKMSQCIWFEVSIFLDLIVLLLSGCSYSGSILRSFCSFGLNLLNILTIHIMSSRMKLLKKRPRIVAVQSLAQLSLVSPLLKAPLILNPKMLASGRWRAQIRTNALAQERVKHRYIYYSWAIGLN